MGPVIVNLGFGSKRMTSLVLKSTREIPTAEPLHRQRT